MDFYEVVIAILAIVGGIGFAIFLFSRLFDLADTWMKNRGGGEDLDRLGRAFVRHRNETDRRLKSLEAALGVAGGEQSEAKTTQKSVNDSSDSEGAEPDEKSEAEPAGKRKKKNGGSKRTSDGNLQNMLRK